MKKIVLSLLLAIVCLQFISAIDISLTKTSYYPGETLQAEISGSFIDNLIENNIGIYKSDSVHKIPAESGMVKDGNKYLFYAVLPELESAGDYYLKIDNTRYYLNNIQTSNPLISNFTIVNTNESYLSFNPGFISATNDFSVKIKAYNQEQTVNVEFPETGFTESFNLGNLEEKIVYFSIAELNSSVKSTIKINSYNVQALIYKKLQQTSDSAEITRPIDEIIEIIPDEINATILPNLDYYFKITIYNNLFETISPIEVSTSGSQIKASTSSIELSDRKDITLTINSANSFNGKVTLKYKNSSISIPLRIIITKSQNDVAYTTIPTNELNTCSERGGEICNSDSGERCTGGSETFTSDGICCNGTCVVSSSSSGWIWGLVLLILVGVAGYFIYKKQKQTPGKEKLSSVFQKKTDQYKQRISPAPPGVEVRKSISKN